MSKILLNGLLLKGDYSGVQYATEYFIDALSKSAPSEHEFTVLVPNGYDGSLKETACLTIRRVDIGISNRLKRIAYENFELPKYFREHKYQLYHSLGYTLPFFSGIPSVVTIHDLIALDYPELCKNETAIYYNLFIPRSLERSKKIIAVSNTVKANILSKFPNISESKIDVAYHGIHDRFCESHSLATQTMVKSKLNLPDNFFLFVGNLEPKKNLFNIVEAFFMLKRKNNIPQKLLIVGAQGWKNNDFQKYLSTAALKNEVIQLGYVDEADLPVLYTMAELFLFPSLYEGFGLPVLEAMLCGCPVIISDRGALPEISGGLCPLVNPFNLDEIADAILSILTNKEKTKQTIELCKSWSEKFRWNATAKKVLEIYSSAVTS